LTFVKRMQFYLIPTEDSQINFVAETLLTVG